MPYYNNTISLHLFICFDLHWTIFDRKPEWGEEIMKLRAPIYYTIMVIKYKYHGAISIGYKKTYNTLEEINISCVEIIQINLIFMVNYYASIAIFSLNLRLYKIVWMVIKRLVSKVWFAIKFFSQISTDLRYQLSSCTSKKKIKKKNKK